jgi:hypothetical protein
MVYVRAVVRSQHVFLASRNQHGITALIPQAVHRGRQSGKDHVRVIPF